jgi:hypothetical protein
MTLARWSITREYGSFPIERAALGACDAVALKRECLRDGGRP